MPFVKIFRFDIQGVAWWDEKKVKKAIADSGKGSTFAPANDGERV